MLLHCLAWLYNAKVGEDTQNVLFSPFVDLGKFVFKPASCQLWGPADVVFGFGFGWGYGCGCGCGCGQPLPGDLAQTICPEIVRPSWDSREKTMRSL
ncbi:hypothetical protein M5D96_012874 [Drosophila gunungcola]|uniref:Uncharacterized protein n=1 Tax=Drosophila gunungcola TaxID=103775 RepID=A0A9P9YCB7_9MUSC|nr:hypothetical protein M5D96_012874 [Drosophila gunungcola]